MQQIQLYNNLSRRKEVFQPIDPEHVKIYACGVTVYDHCHIGHAMQAIYFDMMRQYLRFVGYRVTYVRNYTDVDDKIINRARDIGIPPDQLAQEMVNSCDRDMEDLGIQRPDHAPRVSQMIPQIIAMIEDLIKNNAAYATTQGDVYYRVAAKEDYGKLSNVKPSELRSGTRDLQSSGKEDELDFALWKADNTAGASWPSPWGIGRPGWHIECSAMSKETLGESFDIHGGGRDLIFPHHENEIAQSESANCKTYVNYWLHCGLMTINKQKMSKSLGNHINIRDFLQQWPAEVLRLSILEHHYASNIDFSEEVFKRSLLRLVYYYRSFAEIEARLGAERVAAAPQHQQVYDEFCGAMNDDFNSAAALAVINRHLRQINDALRGKVKGPQIDALASQYRTLKQCLAVLTLGQQAPGEFLSVLKMRAIEKIGISAAWIEEKIADRYQARQAKDFAQADSIRHELLQKGIEVMDRPEGTEWMLSAESFQ